MHDQKTAAPGALAGISRTGRTAAIQAIAAVYRRPMRDVPMDGTAPAAPAPVAPAPPETGAGGGDPLGLGSLAQPVPPQPAAHQQTAPPVVPPVPGPTVNQPGSGAPPQVQPPAVPAAPPPYTGPLNERPIDQFPPEIQGYIAELRKENGDSRVKAKKADDKAQDQLKQWLDGIAKTFGFIAEVPPEATPEQQIGSLTGQLSTVQTAHRDTAVELAIWKGAHDLGANPQRLSDSREFMKRTEGLDPKADDFSTKLSALIGTAVESDPHFKATPLAGLEPPPVILPPVPSGGEFAGGPGGPNTEPTTVDDFRADLKERRKNR